ncbi:MAG: hypothetical protein KBF88_04900 [Polyangiaceae bacterium]|nr:hypothetical protein [Polyangiaceae bacterium]
MTIKTSRSTYGTAAALLVALLSGCGVSQDTQELDSSEDAVKKKVKPKAGNGAVDIELPSSMAQGWEGAFTVSNTTVKAGERVEVRPGSYNVLDHVGRATPAFSVTAGQIVPKTIAGVHVRYEEPITFGGFGFIVGNRVINVLEKKLALVEGPLTMRDQASTNVIYKILAAGSVLEVVLPTTRLELVVDPVDPDYPTYPRNDCDTNIRAGLSPSSDDAATLAQGFLNPRNPNTPKTKYVVTSGSSAPIKVAAAGYNAVFPTEGAKDIKITLNRLEIDHVDVTTPDGIKSYPGKVQLERRGADGNFVAMLCTSLPTKSGVDLLDGTYRVNVTADTPQGRQGYSEVVTFP